MNWEDFHFLRPYWFLAIMPATFLLWQIFILRKQNNFWHDKVDLHLLSHLLVGGRQKQSDSELFMLGFSWLLAIMILAGPVWEKRDSPVFRSNNNLAIVMDLSRSMNANDLIPSRLEFAKVPLEKHIINSNSSRIGLVVFAENAYIASPLARDFVASIDLIKYANTEVMPNQGSRPDRGIIKAIELLQDEENSPGQILLVTDGPAKDKENLLSKAIIQALDYGYSVSILAVGTSEGGSIPANPGQARRIQKEFVKNIMGQPVIARTNHEMLNKMADLGEGNFNKLNNNKVLPRELVPTPVINMNNSDKKASDHAPQWIEYSPYLLFLLIPLSSLAFRRGWVGSILIISVFYFSHSDIAVAQDSNKHKTFKSTWTDLWIRTDYQAYKLFKQNRLQAAAEKFTDPLWQGNSWYRIGEFNKAELAFSKVDSATGHFNRGNALAQQGKIKAAIDAYNMALKLDKEHNDAQVNQKLLKNYLEEKKKNQNPKKPTQGQNTGQGQGRSSKNISSDDPQQSTLEQLAKRQDQKGSNKDENPAEKDKDSKKGKATNEKIKDSENNKKSDAEAADKTALAVQIDDEIKKSATIGPEQWLNMIKDDPSELLKLKLFSEYIKSGNKANEKRQAW